MTFWRIFFSVLLKRPVPALGALYWHMTGRKVRARNRLRTISATLPFAYDLWIATIERNSELAEKASEAIASWSWKPHFLILLYGTPEEQTAQIRKSTSRQLYQHWTLIDLTKGGSAISTTTAANADFVIPLRASDELSETALFRFAEALQQNIASQVLYGDHDEVDARGRRTRPWFKPRWNSEMFLGLDFVSQAVAIKTELAIRTGALTDELTEERLSEALLRAVDQAEGPIVHVPHVLVHVSKSRSRRSNRIEAVARHLASSGATCSPGPFNTGRVAWPLPADLPKVSIVIPTRDHVELLRACVDSLVRLTSYPSYEILIVDNGSVIPETLAYLDQISSNAAVSVLHYDAPYNFSAINNFALGHAAGTFACFLNNDTEIVEPDWLTEMMRYAIRNDVGAVGAKLLYADGTIQHAGIVLGLGDAAGHAHRFSSNDHPGYFRQPHVTQSVTAVTAACLLVEKRKFETVQGFDERELAISYNDVDLCLKLKAAGFRNVYVPHAVLLHHESKSRGSDLSPEQVVRYMRELGVLQDRWSTKSFQDPLHNPNLDRYSETFILRL